MCSFPTQRRIAEGDRFVRDGAWLRGALPLGRCLTGKRVGIIGLGRIGAAIAKRCAAFDMRVAYSGPREKPEAAGVYAYVASMRDLAAQSDFLIVACPGGAATRHVVSAEVLAALGAKGTLVNVSRGSCVDEQALVAALAAGTLGAAALDVFESEPRVPGELCGPSCRVGNFCCVWDWVSVVNISFLPFSLRSFNNAALVVDCTRAGAFDSALRPMTVGRPHWCSALLSDMNMLGDHVITLLTTDSHTQSVSQSDPRRASCTGLAALNLRSSVLTDSHLESFSCRNQ